MDLSDRKVIVFATHGLVAGDLDGLAQPALALSAPDVAKVEGDGLLTMGEIMGLKLDADWVVLSACNTGAGDGKGAEAVSGLGRAFFYAGARALLVSNWPVETNSARFLTTQLFKLQAGDQSLDRARALRRTMLRAIDDGGLRHGGALAQRGVKVGGKAPSGRTIKPGELVYSYAHPILWAPFTLVGDPGGTATPIN